MLGLITGSGFYDLPVVDRTVDTITTPYGDASVTTGRWVDRPVAFVPRHGKGHRLPPARINYRANIWALRSVGASSIVATAVSGGINPDLGLGALVVISDYINFTSGRADTFFDGTTEPFDSANHHVDMTEPYSPALRTRLLDAGATEGIELVDGGVYCATNGPRFETPAEIEMMRRAGGDLVGMTGYPEVALAAEAGLAYASIGVISNPAAGLADGELSANDIFDMIDDVTEPLHRVIEATLRSTP